MFNPGGGGSGPGAPAGAGGSYKFNTEHNVQKLISTLKNGTLGNDLTPDFICGYLMQLEAVGADFNEVSEDESCNTLMHLMVKIQFFQGVTFLLSKNVNLNYGNEVGNTPIHSAAFFFTNEVGVNIIKALASAGADLTGRNKANQMPLQILFMKSDLKMEPDRFHDLVEFLAGRGQLNLLGIPWLIPRFTPINYAAATINIEQRTWQILSNAGVHFNAADVEALRNRRTR